MMSTKTFALSLLALVATFAPKAFAAGESLEARIERVERRLAEPSAREIQSSVDAYLATAKSDVSLVGGAGGAGYDRGFWIRGGSFLLRINLTIQARYEAFRWDRESDEPRPGGDLSGFSLPRVTLKFSGDATCNVRYYAELEFGHAGDFHELGLMGAMPMQMEMEMMTVDPGLCREAWIEYEVSPAFAFRMGLLKTAAPRQLMTPPEMQQFVDVSLAAASVGMMMTGWTDRNRDYGVAAHGVLGCDGQVSYLATITNGDGPVRRNVLDGMTNDNLAYSARVNWDLAGHMGYEECALNSHECEFRAAVGAWAWAYTAVVMDKPHTVAGNLLDWGVDAAANYGGWTACAAYSYGENKKPDVGFEEMTSNCWCVQVGYLFPDTAWEVAARYSRIDMEMGSGVMKMEDAGHEIAFAVNYFIDGHSDKVTADVSLLSGDKDGNNMLRDVYTGYQPTGTGDAVLLRLQWQLAL